MSKTAATLRLVVLGLLLFVAGVSPLCASIPQNHVQNASLHPPGNPVMGLAHSASGRHWFEGRLRLEIATGCVVWGWENASGRRYFLSLDPLGHGASMDLYSYCNGDPVNGLDPDGRFGKNPSDSLGSSLMETDYMAPNTGGIQEQFADTGKAGFFDTWQQLGLGAALPDLINGTATATHQAFGGFIPGYTGFFEAVTGQSFNDPTTQLTTAQRFMAGEGSIAQFGALVLTDGLGDGIAGDTLTDDVLITPPRNAGAFGAEGISSGAADTGMVVPAGYQGGPGAMWIGEDTAASAEETEIHHMLPKQFAPQFNAAGLDVEDYTIEMSKGDHRLLPNGIHTGPSENSWNGQWKQFFGKNPNRVPKIFLTNSQ